MFHPQSSDIQETPDWWIASDGRWYPPELHPDFQAPPPPPMPVQGTGGAALATGSAAVAGVADAASGLASGAADAASGLASDAADAAGGVVSGVGDAASGVASGAGDAAGGVVSGVGDAVGGLASGAGDAAGGVVSGVGDAVGGLASGTGAGLDSDVRSTQEFSELPPLPTSQVEPQVIAPIPTPDSRATIPAGSQGLGSVSPTVDTSAGAPPRTQAVPVSGPPVGPPTKTTSYRPQVSAEDEIGPRRRSVVAGLLALLGGTIAIVGSLLDWGEFSLVDASGAEQVLHSITSFDSSGLITLIAGIGLAIAGVFLLVGIPKQLLWAVAAFIGGAVVVATVIFSLIDIADLAERIKIDWEQRALASVGDSFITSQLPALWAVGAGGVLGVLAAPFVNRD